VNPYPPHFKVGSYRPIYLWGGPGTVRMNRLKFMDVAVDEFVHDEVHTPTGADRVVGTMRCNWVHLMYDWGFPPEVERVDWDDFERAAAVYHDAGTPVFAYIQSSNCVYDGSFREQGWYAADERGRKITYITYSGRYMACLAHPDWRQHLKDLVRGAIERGADGIFLDNLFQGAQPVSLLGAWLGAAGCHCPRCREQYRAETGAPIPTGTVRPEDPTVARYLRWRAGQVTQLVAELAAYADELQPGTPLSANDFDACMRDAYLIYGIDLEALAQVQDVVMIENFGLPRWDRWPGPRLANNALTIRTARPIVGRAAHLSVLSYDVGIGFDPIYPARRYRQGIAEAAACGTSMTTKGAEYHDGEKMTVLTAAEYAPVHVAIGEAHAWLEANAALFGGERRNSAPVGLLHPGEALWLNWHQVAPMYFGAGQALTVAGIPWRVIRPGDPADGLEAVLVFDEAGLAACQQDAGGPLQTQVVLMPALEGWEGPSPSPLDGHPVLRGLVAAGARILFSAYSQNRLARQVMDAAGLPRVFTQSPLYYVPPEGAREALLNALPEDLYPRLSAPEPALIEVWRRGDTLQVHLVNYAAGPQEVQVRFRSPVAARVVSPDGTGDEERHEGARLDIPLDVYKVLLVTPH